MVHPPSTTNGAPVANEGIVAGEEQRHVGDLFRLAHPPEYRDASDRLGIGLGTTPYALRHLGLDAMPPAWLIIEPPASTIRGRTYFIPRKTPRRLIAITRSKASAVIFPTNADSPFGSLNVRGREDSGIGQ
jgi:hypothetical protein